MRAPGERDEQTPGWGYCSEHEPRWPASLALMVALVMYVLLPDKLIYSPFGFPVWINRWTVPVLEILLILPLQFATPHRHVDESVGRRWAAIGLIGLVNLANLGSLLLLLQHLLHHARASGLDLIYSSILIWLTNVIIFGLWYWELDRGGPGARCSLQRREPDFLFPQMSTPESAPVGWTPSFLDYMYVSMTNATAFSPTDTMPLTEWAKGLMAIQSVASLLTIALVAARAVNILQ